MRVIQTAHHVQCLGHDKEMPKGTHALQGRRLLIQTKETKIHDEEPGEGLVS
jgi:hypothetical protein